MTQDLSASPRRGRWWLIAGLTALLLVGAAAFLATARNADDREPDGELVQPSAGPPTSLGLPPDFFPPTSPPEDGFDCVQVLIILNGMIGVDVDYVESRRNAAARLRELEPATQTQQAALEEFADELDAAAHMVEDDPSSERAAFDRESAASDAFIESGGC